MLSCFISSVLCVNTYKHVDLREETNQQIGQQNALPLSHLQYLNQIECWRYYKWSQLDSRLKTFILCWVLLLLSCKAQLRWCWKLPHLQILPFRTHWVMPKNRIKVFARFKPTPDFPHEAIQCSNDGTVSGLGLLVVVLSFVTVKGWYKSRLQVLFFT